MKRLDRILAWLILLLALRAAAIAPREFARGTAPWPTGFWMLSSSLLLAISGSLTLLRLRYGAVAPGLRVVAALTAIAVATLLLIAGTIGGEAVPSAVVAGLLLTTAALAARTGRAA
jgi:hypothetical protein